MMRAKEPVRGHWPEYASEAAALGDKLNERLASRRSFEAKQVTVRIAQHCA